MRFNFNGSSHRDDVEPLKMIISRGRRPMSTSILEPVNHHAPYATQAQNRGSGVAIAVDDPLMVKNSHTNCDAIYVVSAWPDYRVKES